MRHLLNKEITIVSPDGPAEGVTVQGALQQGGPGGESETDFTVTDYTLFLLPEVEITNQDRVIAEGDEFEVVAKPYKVEQGTSGAIHHIEVPLKVAGNVGVHTKFPDEEAF